MISVVKSTTRRHAREKARSSSAATAINSVVKNSSAFNNNHNRSHFQNTGDDALFGGINHLAGSYEKVENDRKQPVALQKQQPTVAAAATVVSTVERKMTTTALSPYNDNSNQQQEEARGTQQPPQTAVAAVAAASVAAADADADAAKAAVVVEPSSAAAATAEGGNQRPRPENIPKFVQVGQKVRFSTVVAAVLIPSSEDITEASKRELWWQATDYADFRLNYAMLMQDPSLEKDDHDYADNTPSNNDENCYGYDNANCYNGNDGGGGRLQGNENAVPYAVASVDNEPSGPATAVGYHHYGNGGGGVICAPHDERREAAQQQQAPTATVEGVLVVAAAPAPAVLASRPYPSNELCHAKMGIGMGPGGKQNGGMMKGSGGGPAVCSTSNQGRVTKSSRYERATRPRSSMNLDEQQQQQQKLASRRHVVAGGGVGGGVAPPAHPHRRHHQAHAGQRVTRSGRPLAPACYGGRRDGRNDSEHAMMPRGGTSFHHGGVAGGGGLPGGGQFFVNGYPAGGYDAPPPRAAYGNNNARYGRGATMEEAYLPVQQQQHHHHHHHQQRHHHVHSGVGMGGGVGAGGVGAAYAPSPSSGVVMVQAPISSQFSMWRSQLVFSPMMQ